MRTAYAVDNIPPAAARSECPNCSFNAWCLPANLSAHETRQFHSRITHRRTLKRNEFLHYTGTPLTSLHVLNSGFLLTRVRDDNGREQITGFSMPGELIGLDAISSSRHQCETAAIEDSQLCGMPFADFEQLTGDIAGLQRHFHRAMGAEITRDYGIMLLLGSLCAEERVALFVLNLSRRFAARGYSEMRFRLPMTRQEIGSYLGLKLETVSRAFSRFNDLRLMAIHGKDIEIGNLRELRRFVEH